MKKLLTSRFEKPYKTVTTTSLFQMVGAEPTSFTKYVPQPFTSKEIANEFRKVADALEKENCPVLRIKATIESWPSISNFSTEIIFAIVFEIDESKE